MRDINIRVTGLQKTAISLKVVSQERITILITRAYPITKWAILIHCQVYLLQISTNQPPNVLADPQ